MDVLGIVVRFRLLIVLASVPLLLVSCCLSAAFLHIPLKNVRGRPRLPSASTAKRIRFNEIKSFTGHRGLKEISYPSAQNEKENRNYYGSSNLLSQNEKNHQRCPVKTVTLSASGTESSKCHINDLHRSTY